MNSSFRSRSSAVEILREVLTRCEGAAITKLALRNLPFNDAQVDDALTLLLSSISMQRLKVMDGSNEMELAQLGRILEVGLLFSDYHSLR